MALDAFRRLGGFLPKRHFTELNPVDMALLMAEWHRFSDCDNDNDCVRCSTAIFIRYSVVR
jgi:hypothetical protein